MKIITFCFLFAGIVLTNISMAQTHLWSGATTCASSTDYKASATDASGNTIVTGTFSQVTDFDITGATVNLTNTGGSDMFIAKYDVNGSLLFAKQIGGSGGTDFCIPNDICLDNAGNIYITGYFMNAVDFDPSVTAYNLTGASYDVFFAKYTNLGVLSWVKRLTTAGGDYGKTINLDNSGNIYLTGDFPGTMDFDPGAGTQNLTAVGTQDIFFAKYTSAGAYIWAKRIGVTNLNYSWFATVDSDGSLIFSGSVEGTPDFDPGTGTANVTGSSYIAKYDGSGNFIWAFSPVANVNSINADAGKNIIYTTYSALYKIDQNGGALWNFNLGAQNIANLDASGNILLAGAISMTTDLDPGPDMYNVALSGSQSGFFACYNTDGDFLWGNVLQGSGYSFIKYSNIYLSNFFIVADMNNTVDFDVTTGTASTTRSSISVALAGYSLFDGVSVQPVEQTICELQNVPFSVSAVGIGLQYQWQVNDGVSWADVVDDAVYSGSQTNALSITSAPVSINGYHYRCYVSNAFGSENSDAVMLTVNPLPDIELGEDVMVCGYETTVLDPGYSADYSYDWNDGSTNPTYSTTIPGYYSVTVSNSITGCTSYDDINISYRYPFNDEQICMVTVDTLSGDNLIVWEKTAGVNTVMFKVYRESVVAGVYDSIGYRNFDDISVWIDDGVDPASQAYFYKITCVDDCGNESPIESCTAHKTIHLQVSPGSPSGYELDWDEYQGFSYPSYKIYRANVGGTFSLVYTISSSLTAWTDVSAPAVPLEYRVAVDKGEACYPTGPGKDLTGPYSQSVSNLEDNGVGVNVAENGKLEISVYPVPANSFLNIEAPSETSVNYEIVNAAGQIVSTGTISAIKTTLDISGFENGVYVLKIKSEKFNTKERFVISR
ncbi:MAG: hypothetical protein A2W91_16075 [Bacteroidetes bacterium GWF2_38_335]|nr:MAG: hypothetical protein A2W91_16075 [Bacteroidetes bacterium GWF2_38_335]OFY81207.1 MAG: hypothetical protein A2281_07050 [Bacteroidetes bacterium RIFOXYA12_FULL_38_20]HBS85323.1 hypothetical protein [Bacteroidales bacterium]